MQLKINSLWKALIRRKQLDPSLLTQTSLNRCLTTFDLTTLGIGSTLGLGIYVLAGEVASTTAGPAVCLSFLIAAIASIFSGLCYAEFGARVPKAGSAYVYSYVTVGEFMAFVIGWNLILEYIIGTASVARGYSGYIDSIFNGKIQHQLREWMPINIKGLSQDPDFLAFGLILALTILVSIGVKESTKFNTVFTIINIMVVLFVIISGSFKVNFHNWSLPSAEVPEPKSTNGNGGFMPFGFTGLMKGAATCFYAFIGFDVIASTGEEAKNPQRSISISIVLSLSIIFLAYFSVSAVQTLMMPYYLQSQELTNGAPLPYIFDHMGWDWAKWIVTVGALTGLSTSLMCAIFPIPRILYAMGSDGIIFRFLAKIHKTTKTPLIGTIISGVFAALMATLFDIKELADMMSIGTLLAYTLVAESILIIRYESRYDKTDNNSENELMSAFESENSQFIINYNIKNICRQCLNMNKLTKPNVLTSSIAKYLILAISTLIIAMNALLVIFEDEISVIKLGSIIPIAIILLFIILLVISLSLQPTVNKTISFQVPWVPIIPLLSCTINIYLMLKLSKATWIRFSVWMTIGFLIYVCYGIRNSNERKRSNYPININKQPNYNTINTINL